MRETLEALSPAVIVTTTAFAASDGEASPLDGTDAPVLQAVIATTRREAWAENPRGLGPADLAMHVVLPELDGRVLAGALAFKDAHPKDDALGFTAYASRPEPDRIDAVADKVAALVRLQETPRAKRRVAVVMPDYPGAGGRTGYAVGLDVPASVLALLADLDAAGYAVADIPANSPALLQRLEDGAEAPALSLADYAALLAKLPAKIADEISAAWGEPDTDPDFRDGAFRFRACAVRHRHRGAAAGPRQHARPARRLSRCHAAAAPCAARLRAVAAARRSRRTRCSISARTARWNGCRARPWR